LLALLALAVLAPLLYLPGALIARALAGSQPLSLERAFERVVLGALLNGWLALTLGQLGIFSAWLHLLIVALICAAAFACERRVNSQEPPPGDQRPATGDQARVTGSSSVVRPPSFVLHPSHVAFRPWSFALRLRAVDRPTLALVAVLLVFGVLVARPFEVVIGVRDAGVYANAGFAMARTGSLVQHDELLAQLAADQEAPDQMLAGAAAQAETNFLGVQQAERSIATRLRAAGFYINSGDLERGAVTPQGLHLFTAWIGLLAALLGMSGGLLAPALMGLLGVWSVGMLGRRLAGRWAGALAALLLALNAAQVWFSRYSTTETTAQFLTFAGLYFFATATDARDDTADGATGGERPFAGLLCGLALGQLALVRIEFFLVLAPLVLYLLYTWVTRRWSHTLTLLTAGLGPMLLAAAVQFTTLSRAYFFDTLFARLQDYALTALVALPFLTPALRETYLTRPCSPLTLQPCPPVAGMPPTSDAPWNIGRIALELGVVGLLVLALFLVRWRGGSLLARLEALLRRLAGPLLAVAAAGTLLLGAYAYLIRPQILTAETIARLPACLAPAQLREPSGACLALQGYVGAPIETPGYVDPTIAFLGSLPQRLRAETPPTPAFCSELRGSLLPPNAKGRTVPELLRDGLLDEAATGEATMAQLRACDRLVLRTQFGNSQANLVRVGWYTSPLGIALGLLGLALLWRRLNPGTWLFLAVALIAGFTFVRLTYGTSDQHYIYILRRYVPQVYPALALGAAVALARIADWRVLKSTIYNLQSAIGTMAALALTAALVLFLTLTGRPIFAHTEYGGALEQLRQIAARFESGDVLLLRGGGPTYAEARDLPDVLSTPLTYAYGLDAITVKSREPGRYAADLARYVREWQARGREVYMVVGASGALPLPGMALEPRGAVELNLREFEQLTAQKPRNVQEFQVDFAVYRVIPADAPAPPPAAVGPADYATQLRGFYRAEIAAGERIAWTNGDGLLRLELPEDTPPSAIALRLAGGKRPVQIGPARACVSARPAAGAWAEDPSAPPFTGLGCFDLDEGAAEYRFTLPPEALAGDALLLRIESEPWIPARDDPQGRDPRRLGVQFAGLRLLP
jgi:hypothetical protein